MSKQTALAWLKDFISENYDELYDNTFETSQYFDDILSPSLEIQVNDISSVKYSFVGTSSYEPQIGYMIPVEFSMPATGTPSNLYDLMYKEFCRIFVLSKECRELKITVLSKYDSLPPEEDREAGCYLITIVASVLVPKTLGE